MNGTMETHQNEKTVGKIVKLSPNGWGFIISPSYQFTRIFFHWTALQQNTLNFTELKVGMLVKFFTQKYDEQGVRAYKLEVISNKELEEDANV
jgi:cold shock CspA family protein